MPIVPSDPALPSLAELLPDRGAPAFVAEAAGRAAGLTLEPAAARLAFVRYRPLKGCVVLWSFPTPDGPLHVSARLFHNERGAHVARRASFLALADRVRARRGGEPFVYLPERRVLLQLFPLDLHLPALPLASDQGWLRETFAPLVPDEVRSVAAEVVSYKAWRRCVYAYTVETANGPRRYFGKLFADARGEDLLRWHRALDAALRASSAPWRVVTPAAHVAEAQLFLIEAVDGAVELRDELRRGPLSARVEDAMERAAEGLAAFQRVELEGLPELPPAEVVRDFARGAEGIEQVAPDLGAAVERALRALDEAARRLPPEPLVTTHGAFRHDQLLFAGDELVAMDLDTLCRSGLSADAGNFLGYLDLTVVRRPELEDAVRRCEAVFSAAALRLPGVTPEWLAWYRAAAHVKKALRSFYSLDRRWPHASSLLLERAQRTLAAQALV